MPGSILAGSVAGCWKPGKPAAGTVVPGLPLLLGDLLSMFGTRRVRALYLKKS